MRRRLLCFRPHQPKQTHVEPQRNIPSCRARLLLAGSVIVPSALATDGYFVQGFGAVNSSLGGAATAGNSDDLIGSIDKNRASGILFADRTGIDRVRRHHPERPCYSSVGARA